jgi:hypothetical protein
MKAPTPIFWAWRAQFLVAVTMSPLNWGEGSKVRRLGLPRGEQVNGAYRNGGGYATIVGTIKDDIP